MMEKIRFNFFQADDIDKHSFYRIPKQLFTNNYFKGLSLDAKILYGLMLDRISLSVKNRWLDEQNRAYIYFSIEEVMEMLDCGKNKAIKCMKELDEETGIGLIRKRRRGFGKSNMIYVKTFQVEGREEVEPSKTKPETEIEQAPDEFDNQTNRETGSDTQVYDVNHVRFYDQTTGSPQNKLHEVCFQDTNNTNNNKTEYSDLKSNRILSEGTRSTGTGNNDAIGYDPFQTDKNHILLPAKRT